MHSSRKNQPKKFGNPGSSRNGKGGRDDTDELSAEDLSFRRPLLPVPRKHATESTPARSPHIPRLVRAYRQRLRITVWKKKNLYNNLYEGFVLVQGV